MSERPTNVGKERERKMKEESEAFCQSAYRYKLPISLCDTTWEFPLSLIPELVPLLWFYLSYTMMLLLLLLFITANLGVSVNNDVSLRKCAALGATRSYQLARWPEIEARYLRQAKREHLLHWLVPNIPFKTPGWSLFFQSFLLLLLALSFSPSLPLSYFWFFQVSITWFCPANGCFTSGLWQARASCQRCEVRIWTPTKNVCLVELLSELVSPHS